MTTPAVILLHPDDNVLVCCRQVVQGESAAYVGGSVEVRADVALGHKIARVALRPGDLVRRYGMPIGSATQPIAAGDWVHLHNMKSNYIDAHTRAQSTEHS